MEQPGFISYNCLYMKEVESVSWCRGACTMCICVLSPRAHISLRPSLLSYTVVRLTYTLYALISPLPLWCL